MSCSLEPSKCWKWIETKAKKLNRKYKYSIRKVRKLWAVAGWAAMLFRQFTFWFNYSKMNTIGFTKGIRTHAVKVSFCDGVNVGNWWPVQKWIKNGSNIREVHRGPKHIGCSRMSGTPDGIDTYFQISPREWRLVTMVTMGTTCAKKASWVLTSISYTYAYY